MKLSDDLKREQVRRGNWFRENHSGCCYRDRDIEIAEMAALKRHERQDCELPCDYCEAEAERRSK